MKHLKRGIAVTAMLGLLIPGQALLTGKALAGNQVNVKMVSYPVTFDGTTIDNAHNKYPLLTYKDITYVPMTWDYARALGLQTEWSEETGLRVFQMPVRKATLQQDLSVSNNMSRTYSAEIASFPVQVNGKVIEQQQEDYPLLTFRDITYFPMTWRFAHDQFNWGYNWDDTEGFSIATKQDKMLTRIVADDEHSLYVESWNGLLTFDKALGGQPVKMNQEEENAIRLKAGEQSAARLKAVPFVTEQGVTVTKQEGDSIKWGEKELLSLTFYKESDAKYYKDHPEDAARNTGVRYFEQVMKVDDQTSVVSLTVLYRNHIPGPYTPHDDFIFVKRGDTITKVENNRQRPNYVMKNGDGSFWLYTATPTYFSTRNADVRGTLILVDAQGQSHSFNKQLGATDIDVLLNTDGTLAVHAYNDRNGGDSKDSDGYYLVDMNQKIKKLFDGGAGQAYVDGSGDMYVVDRQQNRITNMSKNVTGFWWDHDLVTLQPE